jgi:predicted GNAT superfamily acetyltransferase
MAFITITDTQDGLQVALPDDEHMSYLSRADAVEALETLARVLGFTLLDHVERATLLELADEVAAVKGEAFASAAHASIRFEKVGEALATAVQHSLRADDPQEV